MLTNQKHFKTDYGAEYDICVLPRLNKGRKQGISAVVRFPVLLHGWSRAEVVRQTKQKIKREEKEEKEEKESQKKKRKKQGSPIHSLL